MSTLPTHTTRLSILVLTPTFERIQRAAKLSGQALGEFVVMTLLERTAQVLESEPRRVLTERNAQRVFKGLETTSKPSATGGRTAKRAKGSKAST